MFGNAITKTRHIIMSNKKSIKTVLVVLLIVLSAALRFNTFWLPHWAGDQSHYLALALKLDKLGTDYYNLRGIDVKYVTVDKNKKISIIFPALSKDLKSKGVILSALYAAGGGYYDQPLFHLPPGFPYALMLSHRMFAEKNSPYLVVETNIGPYLSKVRPAIFLKSQFYAAIVPFFFSLGLILTTFFIGKVFFSFRIGMYAGFLMAINPVSILSSQKLWSDDMLSLFIALSLFVFMLATKKNSLLFIFISGLLCGVGVLAKQTGGFFALAIMGFCILSNKNWLTFLLGFLFFVFISVKTPVIFFLSNPLYLVVPATLIYIRLQNEEKLFDHKKLHFLFDKRIILFILGVFAVSGLWFLKVHSTFGNPLYLPKSQPGFISKNDISGWSQSLRIRPSGYILYLYGIVYLCPLFGLIFVSLPKSLKNTFNCVINKAYDFRFIVLWSVILFFYYNLKNNAEHRLMLPAYSAIAVLAASQLDVFRGYLGTKFKRFSNNAVLCDVIILTILIGCAFWSVPIGVRSALENLILIKEPF